MANTRAIIDVQINTSQAAGALRSLQTQLNAFQSALNTNNRVQANAAKNLAAELSEMVNAGGFFTAETVRMQTAASRLDKTLQKGQATIGQFWSAKFRKDSAEAASVLSLAQSRAAALQTQFVATGAAANGFRDALAIRPLHAFNSETLVSAERLAIHRAMLNQATTSMINFGKNTQWAGRQLMVGFTVPLTIFAATSGKAFREIEKELVNFRKVYGDAFTPPEEMERNLEAVQGLAKEYTKYGIAVKDTIGLAAQAAAAGAQNADLLDATTEATRLATLGQMEQNQALETTISLQTAFGLKSKDLTKTINFLNMVENQTVVTLQDLAEAIPRVAPVIKGLGGSVEDMAAMLAAMQEGGVSAAQGANALKSGLASLINPTNRAIEKLEEMGINLNYIVQANRGDLMGTVQAFAQALATLDQFQQQQALEKVFGKYQYARLGALFNNIIKDGSQASRVMDTAALSASQLAASADKELGAIEESAATRFTAAMEKLKLAIAPVGEMFTEMAIPVLNFLGKLVEKFNELPDFAKKFIGFGTVITGIVIPAGTMFLGLLMNLVGTLVKFGSIVGIAFKGFASGGIKGAIKGVNQALKYMSLAEIDASTAAMQLGESTDFVNMALRDQPLAAGAASTAIDELAASYGILASRMMDAARASSANGGAFFVPGAAMTAAGRRGASNLAGRPLPIVARNKGGTIPGVGNRDSIPAMLTPGEFVVNKKATQENLHVLQAINSGREVKTLNGGGPSAMTAAMQRVLARVEAQRQEAATIPIAMGGRGPIRVTQSARSAVARGSRNIYDVLTGKYRKGDNVRVDTLRYAVEELGLSPEDLGLKTRGNFTFRMSDKSNLAMMRGTLTRDKLLEELYGSDVYSPLAKQLDSYLGLRLNASTFDRLYREEIGKLPATGITNGRFEKASRNALRRYLDEMNVPKGRRNSFLRDILQGDTVSSNASLTRIKDALDRRGISWQPGSSKKDIYVNINGRPVNLGNLAGREIGNLGRPSGILDFAGLGGSGQAVHANKGGMIMMNGGGRVFLGMPHKFSARNAEVRAALTRSNLEAQNGRFASMPVTDVGSMVQPIGGRSSNIPGLNGVYEVGGSKYVVKVHDTADSALAESRSSKLMRDIFGLTSPDQEVIKMRHPQTGDIVFGVRSPFDPRFAKSTGEIKKGSFAQQLIASAIRRDSDLQPDNVFGSIVADSGAAIFGMNDKGKPRASMPRIIGDNPIAARDQIDINLLRTKGGAKRFFAEASADIARSMTPDQYEKLIKKAIADARSRATAAVDSLPHMTQAERDKYLRTILGDLDDLDLVDWRAVHAHHKGILPEQKKAPTPAAIKKAEEAAAKKEQEEALRIRQKGANEGRPYGINWLNAGGIAVLLKNLKASRSAVSGARLLKPRSNGQPARSSRLVFEDYAYDAWGRSPWMRRNGRLVEAKGTRGSGWIEAISRGYVTQEEVEQIFYGPQSRVAAHGIDPQFLKRFKDLEMQGSYPAGTVESIFPMLSGAQGSYGPGQRGFEREKGFRAQLLPSTLVSTPKTFNTDIAKGIGTQAGIGELGGQHMISLMRFLMEREVDPTLARSILNDAARRLSSGLPNSGVTESGFYKAIAKAENGALMAHKDQLMASGITMNKGGMVGKRKNFYGRFNAKSVELFTRWISSQPYSIAEMKKGVVSDPALAKVFKGGFRRSGQKETLERSTWMTEMPKPGDSMALGALASFSPKGTPVLQHLADSKLRKDAEGASMLLGMDQRSQKRDAWNLKRIMDMGPENVPSWAPERRYYSPMDKTTGLDAYLRDTAIFMQHRKESIKKHKATIREYKKYIPTIIELETPKGTIRANLDDIVPQANQQFMGRQTSEQERILHNAMIKVLDISEEDRGVRRIRAKLLSSAYPGFNAGGSVFDSSRGRRTVPGTGNTDTVPAVLTPGEFVVNKEAARKNMDILHAINSGKAIAPGYAVGSDVVDAGYIEEAGLGRWVHKNADGTIRGRYTSRSAAERALKLRKESLQRDAQRKQKRSSAAKRIRVTRRTRQAPVTPDTQRFGGRGMGLSMGMGALGGAMMMAPMVPGIGQNEGLSSIMSTGGLALSVASMLPMLGKFGIAVGAVAAVLGPIALSFKAFRENLDETATKAMEFGRNLGGTAGAMEEISKATGYQFSSSRAGNRMFQFTANEAQNAAEFSSYFESEEGQKFIDALKGEGMEKRYEKVSKMLSLAIADGMDPKTAKAYGDAIAFYTNDAMLKMRLATDFKTGKFKKGTDQLVTLLKEREDIVSREVSKQGPLQKVDYGVAGGLAQRFGQTGGNALFANQAVGGVIGGGVGLAGGMLGGAAAGAALAGTGTAIGASLGSIVPVVGTVIGAALGTAVGIGIAALNKSSEMKKLEQNGKTIATIMGSSLEILKDTANAEAAIIEARRNGTIKPKEAEQQLTEVREVEAKAAGRLREALEATATGEYADVESLQKGMENNLIISGGFTGDQAQAVIETVSFDNVATRLGYKPDIAREDPAIREAVVAVMVETLSGITPENMSQKLSQIEGVFAAVAEELVAAAASGLELDPDTVRGLVTAESASAAAKAALRAASGETGPSIEDQLLAVTGAGGTSNLEMQEATAAVETARAAYQEAVDNTDIVATRIIGGPDQQVAESYVETGKLITERERAIREANPTITDEGEIQKLLEADTDYNEMLEYRAELYNQLIDLSDEFYNAAYEVQNAESAWVTAQKDLEELNKSLPKLTKQNDTTWKNEAENVEVVGITADEAAEKLRNLYNVSGEQDTAALVGTDFITADNMATELGSLQKLAAERGLDFMDVLSQVMATSMSDQAIDSLIGNESLLQMLFPDQDIEMITQKLQFLGTMAKDQYGLAEASVVTETDRLADSFGNLATENEKFLTGLGTTAEEISVAFSSLTDMDLMTSIATSSQEFQRFSEMVVALSEFPGIDIQVMMKTEEGRDPKDVAKDIETTLKQIGNIDFKNTFGSNWKEMQQASQSLDPKQFISFARGIQDSMGKAFDPEQITQWYKNALKDVDKLRDEFKGAFDKDTGMIKKLTVPMTLSVFGQDTPNAQAITDAVNAALPDGFNPMILPIIAQLSIDPRLAEVLKNPEAIGSLAKYISSGGTESQTFSTQRWQGTADRGQVVGEVYNWSDYVSPNIVGGGSPFAGATTPGGDGTGGQKQTTILEDLKKQLKQIKELFKGLSKFFRSNSESFRKFIAGPFAPEFLEYLKGQGEKGLKLVKEGGKALLEAYKAFERVQIGQIAIDSLGRPLEREFNIRRQAMQSNVSSALAGQGLSNDRVDYVMEEIGPERLAALQALLNKRDRTTEDNAQLNAIQRDVQAAVAQSGTVSAMAQLDSVRNSLNETATDFSTFIQLTQKGIDPVMAQSMMELGISVETATAMTAEQLKKLEQVIRGNKIAEAAKEIKVGLQGMADEIKLTTGLASLGFVGETAEDLKSLGVNLEMLQDKPEIVKEVAQALSILKMQAHAAKSPIEKLNELLSLEASSIQAQIEKSQRLNIKPLEDELAAINERIEKKQRDIELEERLKEKYEDNIDTLQDEQDTLQKTYDERIKALEKVANINERIARQQQSQMDVASALSRGDIAGAAAAALQAQQEAARQRVEEARGAITAQYETDRQAIEEKIKNERLEIEKIDERIKTMQMDMRDIQDDAYDKQKEIENAKKEQLKLEEKLYKAQLLQNILQARSAVQQAARTGDKAAVQAAQGSLSAMVGIAGKTPEERATFFQGIAGAEGVLGEAQAAATQSPEQAIASSLASFGNLAQLLHTNATKIASDMLAAETITQAQYDAFIAKISDPETGAPLAADKIIAALLASGWKLTDVLTLNGQNPPEQTVPGLVDAIGNAVATSAGYIAKMPPVALAMYEAFKDMKKILDGRISDGRAVVGAINAAISAWNSRPQQNEEPAAAGGGQKPGKKSFFGGAIPMMFGGNVNYRGSTERAPGLMYGGKMKKFAYGSMVPGIGMTDKVPALLTPGEFVVRKSVAAEYGPLLTAINSNVFPKMNMSGAMPKNSSNTRDGIQYNYEVNVNVAGTNASPDDIANTVMYKIKRMDERQIRGTSVG